MALASWNFPSNRCSCAMLICRLAVICLFLGFCSSSHVYLQRLLYRSSNTWYNCISPKGSPGTCIKLSHCPTLQSCNHKHLRGFACEKRKKGFKVCCPLDGKQDSSPIKRQPKLTKPPIISSGESPCREQKGSYDCVTPKGFLGYCVNQSCCKNLPSGIKEHLSSYACEENRNAQQVCCPWTIEPNASISKKSHLPKVKPENPNATATTLAGTPGDCVTPKGLQGDCIKYSSCSTLKSCNLEELVHYICDSSKKALKVCCPRKSESQKTTGSNSASDKDAVHPLRGEREPECKTPSGEPGICMKHSLCSTLKTHSISLLGQYLCETATDELIVCCPESSQTGTLLKTTFRNSVKMSSSSTPEAPNTVSVVPEITSVVSNITPVYDSLTPTPLESSSSTRSTKTSQEMSVVSHTTPLVAIPKRLIPRLLLQPTGIIRSSKLPLFRSRVSQTAPVVTIPKSLSPRTTLKPTASIGSSKLALYRSAVSQTANQTGTLLKTTFQNSIRRPSSSTPETPNTGSVVSQIKSVWSNITPVYKSLTPTPLEPTSSTRWTKTTQERNVVSHTTPLVTIPKRLIPRAMPLPTPTPLEPTSSTRSTKTSQERSVVSHTTPLVTIPKRLIPRAMLLPTARIRPSKLPLYRSSVSQTAPVVTFQKKLRTTTQELTTSPEDTTFVLLPDGS